MGQRIITKKATVLHFRRSLCIGLLEFDDGTLMMHFCSTCFHSSPARFPREGERVEVLIDADTNQLILVRDVRPDAEVRNTR